MKKTKQSVRIIPLGGLGEVGTNMMLFEYQGKILICDMGFKMPEEDMPGVDYTIPNITYLKGKEKDVVGVVFTHGHYDHIGAVPYVMEKIWRPNIVLYAAPLARGIILKRQDDFPNCPKLKVNAVKDGDKIKLGPFEVEFFRQNHSIPDNMGLFIKTPVGNILHTSDFKFDSTPVNEPPTNFEKLKRLSKQGVLLLLSDSTDAESEGHSPSEKLIEQNLEEIFKKAQGRIIAATFASLINRIQQMITLAEKYGRKVSLEGYSMKTNVEIARILGYIKAKKGTIIKSKQIKDYPDSKVVVLCTGAQGEGGAALMRIANKEHQTITLKKNDTVILSSSVIPGNERTVQKLKDRILRQQAKVFHYKMMDIHSGGHAKREELQEMIKLIKPKFFMPIHGQYSMLVAHAELAKETGINEKNIVVAENGKVVNIQPDRIYIEQKEVPSNCVMIDGLGIGDVGEVVLRDRQMLAEDGMFVIIVIIDKQTGRVKGSPDIISRGFIYLRESKDLLKETRRKVIEIINKKSHDNRVVNWSYLKDEIRNKIGKFFYVKTERKPMILPVIIEV